MDSEHSSYSSQSQNQSQSDSDEESSDYDECSDSSMSEDIEYTESSDEESEKNEMIDEKQPKKRKNYTISFRLQCLEELKQGKSARCVGRDQGVDHKSIIYWSKNEQKYLEINKRARPNVRCVSVKKEYKYQSLLRGAYNWLVDQWEQDITVQSSDMIAFFVKQDHSLKEKTYSYLIKLNFKFRQIYNISLLTPSNRLIKSEDNEEELIDNFYVEILEKLKFGFSRQQILNFDQTSIYWESTPSKILAPKGTKNPYIEVSDKISHRVTLILIISANGDIYTPFVIFKAKRYGYIHKKLIREYQNEHIYCTVQQNAWCDRPVIQEFQEFYIKNIIQKHEFTLTLCDSYGLHKDIKDYFETNTYLQNNHLFHLIPPGCTPKLQPLDITVNRSFKNEMRKRWSTNQGIEKNRDNVVQDILYSIKQIKPQVVQTSFNLAIPFLQKQYIL